MRPGTCASASPRSSRRPRRPYEAGWLDDTAPDADPARAALAANDAEQTAVAAWDTAREAARATADQAREAGAAESRTELAAARGADAAQAAEQSYEAERRAAESIAADDRLTDLLGLPTAAGAGVPHPRRAASGADDTTDGPHEASSGDARSLTAEEFDNSADELRELLERSVTAAERRLFDLRTAAADDSRILGALGDGGLLPPGPDVLATVEHLGEHGIPALPGWRYLAQAVDPADHAAVLAARPELVDGVVITDPDAHTRAREVLAAAALLPRSAVAVGTTKALLAPVPAPGGAADDGVFLVPPNPAMHDEHAADEERQALRSGQRHATRTSDRSQPGSPPTAPSPPASAPGGPTARPECSPSSVKPPARPAPPLGPRKPNSPRPVPCAPRPTRPPPTPRGSATNARRRPSALAAPRTRSPDSPTGSATGRAGRRDCVN